MQLVQLSSDVCFQRALMFVDVELLVLFLRSGHAGVTLSTRRDILPGRNGPRCHFSRMPTAVGLARVAEEGSCSVPLGCPHVLSLGTVSLLSPAPSRQAWQLVLQTSRHPGPCYHRDAANQPLNSL